MTEVDVYEELIHLGENLRETRERRGHTYRDVANLIGVPASVLYLVERGVDLRVSTALAVLTYVRAGREVKA